MTAQLDNFAISKALQKTKEHLNRLIMIEFIEGHRMRYACYYGRTNPAIVTHGQIVLKGQ